MRWIRPVLVAVLSIGAMGVPNAASEEPPESDPYCADDSLAECEDAPGYGTPAQVSGVETIVPIHDTVEARALYAKLLGPRFTVPATPMVKLIFNDLRLGTYVPGVQDMGPTKYDSRYLEFGIELLAEYGPHIGWFDVRLVLNNRAGFELGRSGGTPKFLGQLLFDQDPRRADGFATAHVGERFVMRADWAAAPDLELGVDYVDPTGFRVGDGTADGDPWNGTVSKGTFTTLPTAPYEWATGIDSPVANPTAPSFPFHAVRVRVRLADDIDQFNVASEADTAVLDPDPLPDLFDEAAGEGLGMLVDLDQEQPGISYGPSSGGLLLEESDDITADGPCADASACQDPSEENPVPSDAGEQGEGSSNVPPSVGAGCQAAATPAGPGTCTFTTDDPAGSAARGFIAETSGTWEIDNGGNPDCVIVPTSGFVTGGMTMSADDSRYTLRGRGSGIGSIDFTDACTFTLTVFPDGAGGVYAGQTT